MTPEELIARYPHLDHMMAETILWAYETGRLNDALENWTTQEPRPIQTSVVQGAIVVKSAE